MSKRKRKPAARQPRGQWIPTPEGTYEAPPAATIEAPTIAREPTARALDILACAGRLRDGEPVVDLIERYGMTVVMEAEKHNSEEQQ